jgi:hypothetical protein
MRIKPANCLNVSSLHALLPLAFAAALSTVATGCAGSDVDAAGGQDPSLSGEAEELVSSSDVGIIAFDGTGASYDQNTSMVKLFRDSPIATTGAVKQYGFPGQTKQYYSYTRTDATGGLRAIYWDGPPEDVGRAAYDDNWDSGAQYILDDAIKAGSSSPVCRLVNNPRVRKVYVVGYSRGAVTAAIVAKRIGSTLCGSYQGAKLAWVGLIDPVATGMKYDSLQGSECQRRDEQVFNHTSFDSKCMAPPTYLNTLGKQQLIPVSLFSKVRPLNDVAAAIKLSTQGMPNAFVDATFTVANSRPDEVHIKMADNLTLLGKLKAAAKRRGGYGF